ncbi:MAG: RDD family protein [Rubricoccaceae bacterium]|nr:RDD family protein [Rubricoccaceae bacterium]
MDPLRVQTAQNVDLAFATAGLGDRLLAWLVDLVVLAAYVVLLSQFSFGGRGGPTLFVVLLLPVLLYHLLFEVFFEGQSPGKRLLKLRVARLDGAQPTLAQYLLRWLLRWVDVTLSSGLVAVVAIGATRHGQRLGDLAAGTTVVRLRRRVGLDAVHYRPRPPGYAPTFPGAERLTDADVRTLRAVLVRLRLEKRSAATRRLAARAKAAVEDRLGLEPVAMPPEPFLRTVVDDYTAAHDRYGA